jgi:hypothetical protein
LKTQIITLASHDDLISVRDKFSWAKTPRILLVWPKYEKVNLRLLDLKILQRHADSLGAQLGLVTRLARVRRDAESLGIPVFRSAVTAQKDPWPDPVPRGRRIPKTPRRDLREIRDTVYKKEPAWRTSLLGRVITFTAGVIAVLAVAGIFVPHAALTLFPEMQTQSVIIPVAASDSTESISITGALPAKKISVLLSLEQSSPLTRDVIVPKSKSRGVVRFTNLSQGEVSIPAGTSVSNTAEPHIKFVTLDDATLEAGIDKFVDVQIEALQPGTDGNVPSDAIVVVDGMLGLSVSVKNPNPTKGGTDLRTTGATEGDHVKLRKLMMENIRRDAEAKLQAQIAPTDVLLLDTIEVAQIVEESFEPPVGQPGKTLNAKLQVEFSALFVSDDDLKELAASTLNTSMGNDFEATELPSYEMITKPSTDASGTSHFELQVTRTLLRKVDPMQVFAIVRGQKPELIKKQLTSELSLREAPEFTVTPSWWPWLPLIPFNISVEIK